MVKPEKEDRSLKDGLLYTLDAYIFLIGHSDNIPLKTEGFMKGRTDSYNIRLFLFILSVFLWFLSFYLCKRAKKKIIYLLPAAFFIFHMILGVCLSYKSLSIFFFGLIFLRLTDVFLSMDIDGRLLKHLIPLYICILLLIVSMPYIMPMKVLPRQLSATGKERMDQYFTEKTKSIRDSFTRIFESEEEKNDIRVEKETPSKKPEQNNESKANESTAVTESPAISQEDDSSQEKDDPGPSRPSDSSLNESHSGLTQNTTGFGISLSLKHDPSDRGRLDLAGNLNPSDGLVATVSSKVKPDKTLYIRLFIAEDFKDNRWNASPERAKAEEINGFYPLEGLYYKKQDLKAIKLSTMGRMALCDENPADLYKKHYLAAVCRNLSEDHEELFDGLYTELKNDRVKYIEDIDSSVIHKAAGKIAKALSESAVYSLSPGDPPKNTDLISWFLTDKKEGYCMYFASTGVMMLRYMGIPARYAEGYSVPVNAWEQKEDGSYEAKILGSNAHAWAECYGKEGAWEPVELTASWDGSLTTIQKQNPLKNAFQMLFSVFLKIFQFFIKLLLTAFFLFLLVMILLLSERAFVTCKNRKKAIWHMELLMLFYMRIFLLDRDTLSKLKKAENLSIEEHTDLLANGFTAMAVKKQKVMNLFRKLLHKEVRSAGFDIVKANAAFDASKFSMLLYQAAFKEELTEKDFIRALRIYKRHRII